LALVSFVTAVFLIADGYYWNGIAFIGAGASLSSAEFICKKTLALLGARKVNDGNM
jgi:hypothetical protein